MIFTKLFPPKNLWSAAKRGDVAAIERLVAKGQDINAKRQSLDVEGETPLHFAARAGQIAAIKTLVTLGARINARDNGGMTPLMAALTDSQREDIVELLLDLGADIDAQDRSGMTALDWAVFGSQNKLVQLLLKRGAALNTGRVGRRSSPIAQAVLGKNIECLKLLVDAKADVNTPHAGSYPLDNAAVMERLDFVKILLEAGADPNKQNNESEYTALMCGVAGGNLEIVKMLLNAGARTEGVNSITRETALDIAENRGKAQIAELLRRVGAKREIDLPKRESEADQECGTSWQLRDDSMLEASIEPWPPVRGKAVLNVEICSEPELEGGWNIEYRIRSQSDTAQDWSRMFPAANKGDSDDEQFEAEIALEPGTWVVELKVSGRMQKRPEVLSGWEITVG